MRNATEVAVIMCIYHADCPFKARVAVESMINQSLINTIYLYIDGPIPKPLFEVVSSFVALNVHFASENRGLAVGLNYLIDLAISAGHEFIARMDSDDFSYPSRLESQVDFMHENPNIDVVGTGFSEYGSSLARAEVLLPEHHSNLIDYAITRCPFMHPTVMFRASCFESGLRYPLDSALSEDLALWHVMLQKDYVFYNLPVVLLKFYIDEATVGRRGGMQKACAEFKLRYSFMCKIKRYSVRRVITLVVKFISQNLPTAWLFVLYKYFR